MALRIIVSRYQKMDERSSATTLDAPQPAAATQKQTDVAKFYLFCSVVDRLFESFSAAVSLDSPERFQTTVMAWFNEHCRPRVLRDMFLESLCVMKSQLFTESTIQKLRGWAIGVGSVTCTTPSAVTPAPDIGIPDPTATDAHGGVAALRALGSRLWESAGGFGERAAMRAAASVNAALAAVRGRPAACGEAP